MLAPAQQAPAAPAAALGTTRSSSSSSSGSGSGGGGGGGSWVPLAVAVAAAAAVAVATRQVVRYYTEGRRIRREQELAAAEDEAKLAAAEKRAAAASAGEPNTYEATVERYFPGSMAVDDFVVRVTAQLQARGFHSNNTLTTISIPRDPMMLDLTDKIQKRWGSALVVTSLAGLPMIGASAPVILCSTRPIDTGPTARSVPGAARPAHRRSAAFP